MRRVDIWREGKWLDLWSVVHLLTGVSLALGFSIFRFGFIPTTIITFFILVSYELLEAVVQIEETPQNHFMDVAVGLASFMLTFIYLAPLLMGGMFILVFGLVLAVNVTMATFGWSASRKAIVLEDKLHAEYLEQRRLLLERRARRRERALRRRAARQARKSLRK